MGQKRSRYLIQFTSVLLAVIVVAVGICSYSLDVSASSSPTFDVAYPEPVTSDTRGYIVVMFQSTAGDKYINTFFWSIDPVVDSTMDAPTTLMDIHVSSEHVAFYPYVAGDTPYYFSLYEYGSSNNVVRDYFGYDDGVEVLYWQYYYSSTGFEIIGYQFGGNVGEMKSSLSWSIVPQVNWSGSGDAYTYYYDILIQLEQINYNLGGKLDSVITQLLELINATDDNGDKIDNIYNYLSNTVYPLLEEYIPDMDSTLHDIKSLLDDIKKLTEDEVSWLEKIWNSIQEFFNPDEEDAAATDEFASQNTEKANTMNGLNEQNQTEKVDAGSASSSVDGNLDFDSVATYGTVLSVITGNKYVLQMILVVVSVGLVSYVLFGKR